MDYMIISFVFISNLSYTGNYFQQFESFLFKNNIFSLLSLPSLQLEVFKKIEKSNSCYFLPSKCGFKCSLSYKWNESDDLNLLFCDFLCWFQNYSCQLCLRRVQWWNNQSWNLLVQNMTLATIDIFLFS